MALYITLASSLTLNTPPFIMLPAKSHQYITCAGTATTLQLWNHSLLQSELQYIPSPYHHISFTYSTPKYSEIPSDYKHCMNTLQKTEFHEILPTTQKLIISLYKFLVQVCTPSFSAEFKWMEIKTRKLLRWSAFLRNQQS